MRSIAVLGALWLLAAISPASAQVQVSAQTERTNFLLYERVDLLITITNLGDSDLTLDNDGDQPWLSFLLSRRDEHNYLPIRPERGSKFSALTIKAGATQNLRVNLTPLFTFRQEAEYRVAVVLNIPNQGQIISDNVPFSVLNGRKVWGQVHPVDGSERVYSLIRFSPGADSTALYLRVEDPAKNIVYANVGLGEMVSFVDPQAFFDPQGNLHVMHPTALGTYLYTRADPDGKIVHQAIFKTFRQVPPRLHQLEDGNVIVMGGLEENPNAPREKLSNGQVANKADAPVPQPDAAANAPQRSAMQ